MHTKIPFIIAIFWAFSITLADNVSEKHFVPINSLTESLPQKNKSQINLIIDTTTSLSPESSAARPTSSAGLSSAATTLAAFSSSVAFNSSSSANPAKAPANLDSASAASSALSRSDSAATKSAPSANKKPNPYNLPDELMPLWESMSMRQKAAQMIMVFLTTAQFVIENEIGGVLITGKHFREIDSYLRKMSEIDSSIKIPLFVATDQEGGIVNRLASVADRWHSLPSAREMRHMDTSKIHVLAQKVGQALNEYKINMNLAPVLDPSKDYSNKNSFMEENRRSWGNDTSVAYKVRSFVTGMREKGIVCVSKHFPGYDSWTNSDLQIAVSASPKEKIEQNINFFSTLANDIPITMMSSVHFIRISNRPAVFDASIVKMARRGHPDMLMLTDDLWGTSLRTWASGKTQIPPRKSYPDKDFKRLVSAIIDAGNDILMISYTSKAKDMLDIMMNLCEKSSKYKRRIEESAARILKLKHKMGILK